MGALDEQIGRRYEAPSGYGDKRSVITWSFGWRRHPDGPGQPGDQIKFSDVLDFGHTSLWRPVAF